MSDTLPTALDLETPEERRKRKNREAMRKWRAENPEKSRAMTRASVSKWRAANPEANKERKQADYIKHREARYQREQEWKRAHPERVRELSRDYYHRHHEEERERGREWARNNLEKSLARTNRRRAIKAQAEGSYTPEEWSALCESYGNRCLRCGRSDVALTIDHVIPLYLGGSNDITNLQPLCKPCNSSKGIRMIDYRTENQGEQAA